MIPTNTVQGKHWSLPKKFLFRYFFVLCVVSIVPILAHVPWPPIIKWAGLYFYNEEVTQHPSGSGDTLYHFYSITVKLVAAFIIATIWSIAESKRISYNKLLYWQEVYIRYYLAFFLVVYGLMKVIKLQFGLPSLSALLIPLGQKSPMGLAWTFIGFSDTYTFFSGFCEVLAAAFLLYRKTRTLGALISFSVMANVFLMNMSYDIPVKLFSLELVVLSAFLIALDHKRLINMFILNRPVQPQKSLSLFKDKGANNATQAVKCAALFAGLSFTLYNNLQSYSKYGDAAPKPPLYGIYEVDEFVRNNDTIAPIVTDSLRWRYLVFERYGANVFTMTTSQYDDVTFYKAETDTVKREVAFLNYADSTEAGRLRYSKTEGGQFVFTGFFNNDSLRLRTIRKDEKNFPLMNRGFRWVNEYPYNR